MSEPSKEALEFEDLFMSGTFLREQSMGRRKRRALLLDAFAQPWRDKLAEQCGKTLAARTVALDEAAAACREPVNFLGGASSTRRAAWSECVAAILTLKSKTAP